MRGWWQEAEPRLPSFPPECWLFCAPPHPAGLGPSEDRRQVHCLFIHCFWPLAAVGRQTAPVKTT